MLRRGLFWSALAGLFLVSAMAHAQVAVVGTYTSGGIALDVFTFSNSKGKSAGVGILHRVSVNVDRNGWSAITSLWQKAKGAQGAAFRPVGSFTEPSTKDPSTLTIAGGPGVQLTIVQPEYAGSTNKAGSYSVVIAPKDFARFDGDLAKVAAFLAAP